MRLFTDVSSAIADPYLRRAWLLAENARGATSPNPLVGCVIVRDGVIVGEGWHQRAGEPHAEVMALRSAGDASAGATAYVTLEPCAHSGRTGPCTTALAEAGVVRVRIGARDPNPNVCGGGYDVLRAAGLDVSFAEDPRPFDIQNEAWLHWLRTGRPFVQAKIALTLDGRPALRAGERAQLTGDAARALTMRLRAAADAVMVGAGTLASDDPALTVRSADDSLATRTPLRVVLAGSRPLDAGRRVFTDGTAPTLVLRTRDAAAPPPGVEALPFEGGFAEAFSALGARGITRVLVEPGPRLLTSLLDARAIDELVVYHAPGFAGADAPAAFLGGVNDNGGLERRYRLVECGAAGEDAVTVWRPRHDG